MPKGPNGEKRPVDAIGLAVMTGRNATGEVAELAPDDGKNPDPMALGAKGAKGGKARASSMTPERRAESAKAATLKMATGREK